MRTSSVPLRVIVAHHGGVPADLKPVTGWYHRHGMSQPDNARAREMMAQLDEQAQGYPQMRASRKRSNPPAAAAVRHLRKYIEEGDWAKARLYQQRHRNTILPFAREEMGEAFARELGGLLSVLDGVMRRISDLQDLSWDEMTRVSIPTSRLFGPGVRAVGEIDAMVRNERYDDLERYYQHYTTACRMLMRHIYGEPHAAVILEESGSTALSLIYRMMDIPDGSSVLTTAGGSMLNRSIFAGFDPLDEANVNPVLLSSANCRLFSSNGHFEPEQRDIQTRVVATYQEGGGYRPRSERDILSEVERTVADDPHLRLVLVPLVNRDGRILPARAIGSIVRAENRRRQAQGRPRLYYAVDAVQATGKVPLEMQYRPLEYCDFYYINSSKGLGAMPVASVVLARPERVRELLPNLMRGPGRRHIKRFQFDPQYEPELSKALWENTTAVSLPELVSLNTALCVHFGARVRGFVDVPAVEDILAQEYATLKQRVAFNLEDSVPAALSLRTALLRLSRHKRLEVVGGGSQEGEAPYADTVLRIATHGPPSGVVRRRLMEEWGIITGFVQDEEMGARTPKAGQPIVSGDMPGLIRLATPWHHRAPDEEFLLWALREIVEDR